MTTATLEPTPVQNAAMMNFRMPTIQIGQSVVWHQFGQKEHGRGEISFVIAVSPSGRTIAIRRPTGHCIEGVRHINDPKLQLDIGRENGAWEYTEEFTAYLKFRDETEQTIQMLTEDVSTLKKEIVKLQQSKSTGSK